MVFSVQYQIVHHYTRLSLLVFSIILTLSIRVPSTLRSLSPGRSLGVNSSRFSTLHSVRVLKELGSLRISLLTFTARESWQVPDWKQDTGVYFYNRWPLRGLLYWYLIKSLQLIWRLGTYRFHSSSLWPSDAIWQQGSRSKLVQVMACCLMAPSHYLNQHWLIITKVQWCSSEGNFAWDITSIN